MEQFLNILLCKFDVYGVVMTESVLINTCGVPVGQVIY